MVEKPTEIRTCHAIEIPIEIEPEGVPASKDLEKSASVTPPEPAEAHRLTTYVEVPVEVEKVVEITVERTVDRRVLSEVPIEVEKVVYVDRLVEVHVDKDRVVEVDRIL